MQRKDTNCPLQIFIESKPPYISTVCSLYALLILQSTFILLLVSFVFIIFQYFNYVLTNFKIENILNLSAFLFALGTS